jgi:hypothetical protein
MSSVYESIMSGLKEAVEDAQATTKKLPRRTVPESISAATLRDMDKAISNFKMGEVSQPIDLSDF